VEYRGGKGACPKEGKHIRRTNQEPKKVARNRGLKRKGLRHAIPESRLNGRSEGWRWEKTLLRAGDGQSFSQTTPPAPKKNKHQKKPQGGLVWVGGWGGGLGFGGGVFSWCVCFFLFWVLVCVFLLFFFGFVCVFLFGGCCCVFFFLCFCVLVFFMFLVFVFFFLFVTHPLPPKDPTHPFWFFNHKAKETITNTKSLVLLFCLCCLSPHTRAPRPKAPNTPPPPPAPPPPQKPPQTPPPPHKKNPPTAPPPPNPPPTPPPCNISLAEKNCEATYDNRGPPDAEIEGVLPLRVVQHGKQRGAPYNKKRSYGEYGSEPACRNRNGCSDQNASKPGPKMKESETYDGRSKKLLPEKGREANEQSTLRRVKRKTPDLKGERGSLMQTVGGLAGRHRP